MIRRHCYGSSPLDFSCFCSRKQGYSVAVCWRESGGVLGRWCQFYTSEGRTTEYEANGMEIEKESREHNWQKRTVHGGYSLVETAVPNFFEIV